MSLAFLSAPFCPDTDISITEQSSSHNKSQENQIKTIKSNNFEQPEQMSSQMNFNKTNLNQKVIKTRQTNFIKNQVKDEKKNQEFKSNFTKTLAKEMNKKDDEKKLVSFKSEEIDSNFNKNSLELRLNEDRNIWKTVFVDENN